jgi:ubiquinone biosynthesis protein UbiJ
MVPVTLIATAGTALVTAMVTDSWEGVRTRIARWFGRGNEDDTKATLIRLEQSRSKLETAPAVDLDRIRMEQEITWRTRMSALLDQHPDAEAELAGIVAEIQASTAGHVQQHVTAYDQAQVNVQGHGVQNITFGNQSRPAT